MKRTKMTFLLSEICLFILLLLCMHLIFSGEKPQKRVAVIVEKSGDEKWDSFINGLKQAAGIRNIHLIVNRIRYDMVRRGDMMTIEDIVDILSLDLIGVIPDDENVVVATNQGETLIGSGTASGKAYENICRRIMGEEVPLACYPPRRSFFFRVADYLVHR